MLFTRWFIHEWLCIPLCVGCLCVTGVDGRITQGMSTQHEMGLKVIPEQRLSVWNKPVFVCCSCVGFTSFPRRICCMISFMFLSSLLPDFDPNLGMMAGITPLNPMMPGLSMVPAPLSQDVPLVKEIIHCKSCTLFPPNPSKSWNHAILIKVPLLALIKPLKNSSLFIKNTYLDVFFCMKKKASCLRIVPHLSLNLVCRFMNMQTPPTSISTHPSPASLQLKYTCSP